MLQNGFKINGALSTVEIDAAQQLHLTSEKTIVGKESRTLVFICKEPGNFNDRIVVQVLSKSKIIVKIGILFNESRENQSEIFRDEDSGHSSTGKWIGFDAICPHSNGPLFKGEIETIPDLEDFKIECPWHGWRFSLKSGKSDHDEFDINLYSIVSRNGMLYLNYPGKVVKCDIIKEVPMICRSLSEMTVSPVKAPLNYNPNGRSLVEGLIRILNTASPEDKVELTLEIQEKWLAGELDLISSATLVPDRPAREVSLEFVDPGKTKRRGKGGTVASRIAILHALANVEQWAIDLAIDIMARFHQAVIADEYPLLCQREFFTDFIKIAAEESKHFTYLVERLRVLGAEYGDLPVHCGLWDSATQTKDDLAARLAIVHMVHESRGLDVNPQTIEKFRRAGDLETVSKLTEIHNDEVGHVGAGQKWFSWICELEKTDKYQQFHKLVRANFDGLLKPPFNEKDRERAGLDTKFYLPLSTYPPPVSVVVPWDNT